MNCFSTISMRYTYICIRIYTYAHSKYYTVYIAICINFGILSWENELFCNPSLLAVAFLQELIFVQCCFLTTLENWRKSNVAAHESPENSNRRRLILLCRGIPTLFWFDSFKGKRTPNKTSPLFVIVNQSYIWTLTNFL